MAFNHDTPPRPVRAAGGLLAALFGVLLVLAGIVVGAVPAAAQNAVGASTPAVANTVGSPAGIGAGQRLGNTAPQPQIVVATAVAAETGPELAAYGGGKTSGVLVRADGTATELTSGLDGPSALLPKPRPGMNGNIVGHVESHAAALMRQEGLDEATLWINRIPCGGPNGCMVNLSRMVPSGSTLNVFVTPGGSAAGLEDWIIVTGTGG